jgi:hypothetical protein
MFRAAHAPTYSFVDQKSILLKKKEKEKLKTPAVESERE